MGLLDKDVELLEGVIVEKISKSALHQSLVRRLHQLLEQTITSGLYVDRESPITCSDSEPEPDLAVFKGDPMALTIAHPITADLVIEVTINTHQKDLRKAGIYALSGFANIG